MDISKFQKVNAERAIRWHHDGKTSWSLLEWAGAMCGEAGEAANYAKKIRRLDQELPNKEKGLDKSNLRELEMKCAMEIADNIIYGLIMLSKLDIDVSVVLTHVFDKKSIEYGFPERAPKE
jgi:NTP pyrophosphatase (non-canonical NTP hydrolase)